MPQVVNEGNPVIRHKYTCDPTAIVEGDRVFLYTGHDECPVGTEEYLMHEWLCFSSDNLHDWTEHPVPLKAIDFKWAKGDAYASKVIKFRNRYYWFVSVSPRDGAGKAIGVAVSELPTGPFYDAIGSPLVSHDMLSVAKDEKANLDPTVMIDHDDVPYIIWGNGMPYFARLNPNMLSLGGDIKVLELPGFEEGSHLHCRNGWYYLSYGYGMPERVAYAMSDSIHGPWKFKGVLNDVPENCETNRPCIIDFKGSSYFIYHNGALPNGSSHRRSVCVDHLNYNHDNTMQPVVMTGGVWSNRSII